MKFALIVQIEIFNDFERGHFSETVELTKNAIYQCFNFLNTAQSTRKFNKYIQGRQPKHI